MKKKMKVSSIILTGILLSALLFTACSDKKKEQTAVQAKKLMLNTPAQCTRKYWKIIRVVAQFAE